MDYFTRVKELVEKSGLTFTALERKLQFSNYTLKRWENSAPKLDNLVTFANYFDVSIDYLLGRTNNPHSCQMMESLFPPASDLLEYISNLNPSPEQSAIIQNYLQALKGFEEK